jgi:hypothetical protein
VPFSFGFTARRQVWRLGDGLTDALDERHLFERYPLAPAWSRPTVVEDTYDADGVELRRAGVSSKSPAGEEIVGSAAERGQRPLTRAYFELLERASTIEWLRSQPSRCDLLTRGGAHATTRPWADIVPESVDPLRWRYARSNGVALYTDWQNASERALWELCERDRVLRSWYGETVPERTPLAGEATSLQEARSYEWLAYSFPGSDRAEFSRGVHVVGVFGIPTTGSAPFVSGYGARPSGDDALRAAVREATQLLAFLWGEPLPAAAPPPAPTPAFHLDAYQWGGRHALVRRWLEGHHAAYGALLPKRPKGEEKVLFVDLTPGWLTGLRVAKAVCPAALPLIFGEDPLAAHLPTELRTHPIG